MELSSPSCSAASSAMLNDFSQMPHMALSASALSTDRATRRTSDQRSASIPHSMARRMNTRSSLILRVVASSDSAQSARLLSSSPIHSVGPHCERTSLTNVPGRLYRGEWLVTRWVRTSSRSSSSMSPPNAAASTSARTGVPAAARALTALCASGGKVSARRSASIAAASPVL